MNLASLKKFSDDLRRLPTVVAQQVTAACAPALTAAARRTFDAGEDAYGSTWAIREDGTRATLKKTGALESKIHYVAIGTKLRVALGVPYAKYLIGKRPVFPRQGGVLPVEYSDILKRTAVDVCRREMHR